MRRRRAFASRLRAPDRMNSGSASVRSKSLRPGLNLSPSGDLAEAAANLFAHLREIDAMATKSGLECVAVAAIPEKGLGEAINDRLRRAAAPRPAG